MLKLDIPPALTTFDERLRFCEVAREKLRRLHNEWGEDFREKRITEVEWQAFLDTEFSPKNTAVGEAILALRAEVKDAARALPDNDPAMNSLDLDTVFSEVAVTP